MRARNGLCKRRRRALAGWGPSACAAQRGATARWLWAPDARGKAGQVAPGTMLVLYVRLHLRFLEVLPDLIDQTSHSDDRTISMRSSRYRREKLFHDGVALTERKDRLQSSYHTPFIHQSQDAGGTLGRSVVCRSARRLLPHHHRHHRQIFSKGQNVDSRIDVNRACGPVSRPAAAPATGG